MAKDSQRYVNGRDLTPTVKATLREQVATYKPGHTRFIIDKDIAV